MNITKVKYERLFPVGAYLNEKIGFEAEIGSIPVVDKQLNDIGVYPVKMESPQEVINNLRQLAEDIHKTKYPHFYTEGEIDYPYSGLPMPSEQSSQKVNSEITPSKDERISSFIATINMCSSKKFLENFSKRVSEENNPELTEAFNNKLKSFE